MFKLTDAEWGIMEILWEKGVLSTMEIVREMEETKGWKKSTVITILNRMVEKGSISYKTKSKSKLYFTMIDREQARIDETRTLFNKLYGGRVGLMISSLLKNEHLSKEEIEEIRKIIEEA